MSESNTESNERVCALRAECEGQECRARHESKRSDERERRRRIDCSRWRCHGQTASDHLYRRVPNTIPEVITQRIASALAKKFAAIRHKPLGSSSDGRRSPLQILLSARAMHQCCVCGTVTASCLAAQLFHFWRQRALRRVHTFALLRKLFVFLCLYSGFFSSVVLSIYLACWLSADCEIGVGNMGPIQNPI